MAEQQAHQRRQEQHDPHDGVDDGFLLGLFVENAHEPINQLAVTKLENLSEVAKFFQPFLG